MSGPQPADETSLQDKENSMPKEQKERTDLQVKMDAAAAEAVKELPKMRTAAELGGWFVKWYMAAGHKRLSRAVVAHYKK